MTIPSSFGFGLFFGTFFLMNGLMLAYWPVWLKDRGLDAAAIGLLLFAGQWIKVAGTLLCGDLADRFGIARPLIVGLAAAALLVMGLFGLTDGFWLLLGLTLLWGLAWPSILPIVEGQAMQAATRGDFDYGRTRIWGSLTFILATIGGGYVLQHVGSGGVHGVMLAAILATVVAGLLLPAARRRLDSGGVRGGAMLGLLRDRTFQLFLVAGGAIQVSHAVYYAFGTLEWRAAGLDDTSIGVLWAAGVVAEIGLFALGRQLAERIGIVRLLLIAGGAGIVRWSLTPYVHDFAPLVALQSLHALTFGAAHLAAMMFIQRTIPGGAVSSAQAIYAAIPIGLGMGLAMMAAGAVYDRLGGATYLGMAVLAAVSLAATTLLWRRMAAR